jgi:hypothetical protein
MIDRPHWGHLLHNVTLATVRAHWQTTTHDFAKCREIRIDLVERLHATIVDAETRHHFVKDEQRVVGSRHLP